MPTILEKMVGGACITLFLFINPTAQYNTSETLLQATIPSREIVIEVEKTVEIEKKSEIILAEVSAYSSSIDETDDTPFIAANGKRVYNGMIACPSRFPFETEIEILGETYKCGDRMAKRYRDGNHFDVWMESKEEAKSFGRIKTKITIKQKDEILAKN